MLVGFDLSCDGEVCVLHVHTQDCPGIMGTFLLPSVTCTVEANLED